MKVKMDDKSDKSIQKHTLKKGHVYKVWNDVHDEEGVLFVDEQNDDDVCILTKSGYVNMYPIPLIDDVWADNKILGDVTDIISINIKIE